MPTSQRELSDPSGRRGRSLPSFLTSAFSTKPRNLTGFSIVLDEPHRRYAPGESVKGRVELTVHKVTRITHLVLSLLGWVKVYKHPVDAGDGVPADVVAPCTGRGKRGIEYHGNGQALLFEEEKIICGDGRLLPGRYSFEFGLKFPSSGLPSSLNFERGTIAYSLVSTLTRPTTINPTITYEHKVQLDEAIDVALRKPPKPDLITITPMFNRTKPKRRVKVKADGSSECAASGSADPSGDCSRSQATTSQDGSSDRPARRDSGTTSIDSSNQSVERPPISHNNSLYDDSIGAKTVFKGKTITARIELLRGGYLPGEIIPVRVMVQHTKFVKSIPGVIVTLFRIGRIDRHPLLPVTNSLRYATSEKGQDPNSQVGISGLSLSTADKSHSFRMDLAQNMAPMVVNPNTLQAEIKTGVRIPEGTFPTISGVPGRLISFTYHVEVVMDLHGRLSALDGILPRMNISDPGSVFGMPSNLGSTDFGSGGPSQDFLNTAQLRREKSIADSTFDIVIGTKDSSRRAAKKPVDPWEEALKVSTQSSDEQANAPQPRSFQLPNTHQPLPQPHIAGSTPDSTPGMNVIAQASLPNSRGHRSPVQPPASTHNLIPPPPIEEPKNEKARLRAAEERLLPSAPPVDYGSSSQLPPSAPRLEDLEGTPSFEEPPHMPSFVRSSNAGPSGGLSRAPIADASDDKQELERQRLLAQASSPYDNDEDADENTEIGRAGPVEAAAASLSPPSAPFFDENGEYVRPPPNGFLETVEGTQGVENLPRYQK